MSKSNAFETALLEYIFEDTAIPGLGANLYVAYHSADPGEAGNQTTNEISATYTRPSVTRGSGFTVSGNAADLAASLAVTISGGTGNATHFSYGTAETGTGMILYSGALDASRALSGVTEITATSLEVTED